MLKTHEVMHSGLLSARKIWFSSWAYLLTFFSFKWNLNLVKCDASFGSLWLPVESEGNFYILLVKVIEARGHPTPLRVCGFW